MKTIPEALKALYVAMGGDEADVANLTVTPDMIEAIASAYQGGGSSLPDVTSEDNGDVLTVVNGAWGKAAIPAVIFDVGVAVTIDSETHQPSATFDKTYAEILAAHESGKIIRVNITMDGTNATLFSLNYAFGTNAFVVQAMSLRGTTVSYAQGHIASNGVTSATIIPLSAAQ